GVALGRPGTRLGSLRLAVAGRRRGHEGFQELARGTRDSIDGALECRLIGARRIVEAADLAHVLKRGRAHLLLGRRRLEVVEGANVATHLPPIVAKASRARGRSELAWERRGLPGSLRACVVTAGVASRRPGRASLPAARSRRSRAGHIQST